MIRYTKHQGINYIIVDSTLEADGVILPIQVQVNVDKVKEIDQTKVFKLVYLTFNRPLNFNKPKAQPKKSWWQGIFKK